MVTLIAPAHDAGHGEPAVDTDRLSRDVAGLAIVEQKCRRAGKLVWGAVAALRNRAHPRRAGLLGMHLS